MEPAEPALRQVGRWLGQMPGRAMLELASRVGYLARGAVYLSVGAIALLAALDVTPKAEGAVGAVQAWAQWPAGMFLIVLVGWGLLAFALWRGLQSVFDADSAGTSAKGLAVRAGQAISAIIHGAMAISVFQLIDGLDDVDEVDEDGNAQETAAMVLDAPYGEWVLVITGGLILTAGVANLFQALTMDVARELRCPNGVRRWIGALGKAGRLGRGVAFAPLGFLFVKAGLEAQASEAGGLGGALQVLERQPFGSLVLSLTAVGLIAFGLFALVEARYRRMEVPKLAS